MTASCFTFVFSEQYPSGLKNKSAFSDLSFLGMAKLNQSIYKKGCLACGCTTCGIMLLAVMNCSSYFLSNNKWKLCSGCISANRRKLSQQNLPIPSSLFGNKSLVLTAISICANMKLNCSIDSSKLNVL